MRPVRPPFAVLPFTLASLSTVFALLTITGIVRAIYHPSPGLLLSIFISFIASVAFALSAKRCNVPGNEDA